MEVRHYCEEMFHDMVDFNSQLMKMLPKCFSLICSAFCLLFYPYLFFKVSRTFIFNFRQCMLRSCCSAAVPLQCVLAFGMIFIWALGHSVTGTQVSYFSSSEEGQAGMSESALSACCAPSY